MICVFFQLKMKPEKRSGAKERESGRADEAPQKLAAAKERRQKGRMKPEKRSGAKKRESKGEDEARKAGGCKRTGVKRVG
ncbi:hypothetical protein LQ50_06365 [Halalkalibacter okhensis]|uniref:Uncharacterized protein n=1 Tax=Halalkalibacter okhensis TaxID=333138 RepID=A0A0B0IMU9_9BACI|nr:hypothetical protein LQ50_06365 [Halalkalibacter okhensis]